MPPRNTRRRQPRRCASGDQITTLADVAEFIKCENAELHHDFGNRIIKIEGRRGRQRDRNNRRKAGQKLMTYIDTKLVKYERIGNLDVMQNGKDDERTIKNRVEAAETTARNVWQG